jgi:hypothetical protein
MMAPEFVGKNPEAVAKILMGARGGGVAANMPIRKAISDVVNNVAARVGAKVKRRDD